MICRVSFDDIARVLKRPTLSVVYPSPSISISQHKSTKELGLLSLYLRKFISQPFREVNLGGVVLIASLRADKFRLLGEYVFFNQGGQTI